MARKNKLVQLRPLEDDALTETPIVRLNNPQTIERLGPLEPIRLDVPVADREELRTHQPNVECIIKSDSSAFEMLEQNWGGHANRRHSLPWGWFALIGLILTGAVVWSWNRVENADLQADLIRQETQSSLIKENQENQQARQLVERLHQTLRDFFDTSQIESRAGLVRHADRVTPLMRRYYADKPVFSSRVKDIKMLQPLTLETRSNFWMAVVELTNGKRQQLLLEITPTGQPLIDWETLVCYQPMKWEDFITQRPANTPLDFRVYVAPDHFYNYEFSDAKSWTCFRLSTLGSEETLFGYVPAGSAKALALLRLIQINRGHPCSLILRLSIPPGLQSRRGVLIDQVLSNRWLYLDAPDARP